MRPLGLFIAAIPVAFFAYVAWSRALRMIRQDAKEAAALKLAENHPPFARALATVTQCSSLIEPDVPWHRPEHESRSVYVLRGGVR